jgi:RNA polymerase sigma factor (sigma-70 family)
MSSTCLERPLRRLVRDQRVLWYVPDSRLRTREAARRAAGIAAWIACEPRPGIRPDEITLFVALHTCAFRARQAGRHRLAGATQRRWWVRRWNLIREYIVSENLGLAYTMIARFRAKEFDHDDLVSEAMFALARAVDRFNPWRGFRFSTYACNVIARALMRRGKTEMQYRRLFPLQSEGLFERLERRNEESSVYVERLRRVVAFNLGGLTKIESAVLAKRFPWNRDTSLTFRQIGEAVGLSKERVRQIQNVALTKLREVLRADPLLV